jgi:hypothetical protein
MPRGIPRPHSSLALPKDSGTSLQADSIPQTTPEMNDVPVIQQDGGQQTPAPPPDRAIIVQRQLMDRKIFGRLNRDWSRRWTEEEYKVARPVHAMEYKRWRASFDDCEIHDIPTNQKKERKLCLARLWQGFRRDSFAWTTGKGRIEHWSDFKKRKAAFKFLRSKYLKPSKIWEEYQRTWSNLTGLQG